MLLESAKHESSTHFYHIHHVGNSLCIRRTMFLGVSDTPVVTKSYLSQTGGFVIDFPPFWKVRALALRPGEKPPLCLTGTYGKKSPKKKDGNGHLPASGFGPSVSAPVDCSGNNEKGKQSVISMLNGLGLAEIRMVCEKNNLPAFLSVSVILEF